MTLTELRKNEMFRRMKKQIFSLIAVSVIVTSSLSLSASACGDHENAAQASCAKSSKASGKDALSLASAHAENADAKNLANTRFKVDGVVCSGCEKMISAKVQAIDGVKGVQFYNEKDPASKKSAHFFKVSYEPGKVTNDAILKAVASAGDHYKATPVAN
jgi:copper chaperone CopZ